MAEQDGNQGAEDLKKPKTGSQPKPRLPDLSRLERKSKKRTADATGASPTDADAVARRPLRQAPQTPTQGYIEERPDLELQMDILRRRSRFRLLEVEERFIRRFSFGTACGIYLMNRALWPFLLLTAIVAMSPLLARAPLWFAVLMLVILVLYPPGFVFMCIVAGVVSSSAPYLMYGPIRRLIIGGGTVFYLAAGIFAFIIVIAGVYARRRRWQTLDWASFEEFLSLETRWQAVGIVLWIMLLAFLASAYFMNNFEDIFPIIWGVDFV